MIPIVKYNSVYYFDIVGIIYSAPKKRFDNTIYMFPNINEVEVKCRCNHKQYDYISYDCIYVTDYEFLGVTRDNKLIVGRLEDYHMDYTELNIKKIKDMYGL